MMRSLKIGYITLLLRGWARLLGSPYFKINVIAIRRLRDAGYLEVKTCRNPDTRHLKQYITQRSISRFERRYVTLGQLADDRKVRPIHLARKLDRENVMPINCSSGSVRVYSRHTVRKGKNDYTF